jgi:hypothetical protein
MTPSAEIPIGTKRRRFAWLPARIWPFGPYRRPRWVWRRHVIETMTILDGWIAWEIDQK